MTFAIGGMSFWAPAYFSGRSGAPDLGKVNLIFGGITAVAGLLSTLFGGWLGDRLARRLPGPISGSLPAACCWRFPVQSPCSLCHSLGLGVLLFRRVLSFYEHRPGNTAIANVTDPAVRSTAFAVNIFVIHALGDAISPPLSVPWPTAPVSRPFFRCVSGNVRRWRDLALRRPLLGPGHPPRARGFRQRLKRPVHRLHRGKSAAQRGLGECHAGAVEELARLPRAQPS